MRTIIAGPVDFDDYRAVEILMAEIPWTPSRILSDGESGASRLGEFWAIENQIPVDRYPEDPDAYGKLCNLLRNVEMAADADALVAIRAGNNKCLDHLIDTARRAGLVVVVEEV